jgi:acylphosphatase
MWVSRHNQKLRIVVTGRVQGVFYRGWTVETARALGVTGWVRNRIDGSVEILACGSKEAVDKLIDACRSGPPAARIEGLDVSEAADPCPDNFASRPTV